MGEDTGRPTTTGRDWRYVPLADVHRATRNPKAHDIDWITSLIAKFGFVGAAVHDGRTGRIIAGHGRLEALERMEAAGQAPPDGIVLAGGGWAMPVEYGWSSRSDAEAEALGVALNEATTRGGWDRDLLAETLRDLDDVDADLRRLTGWDDEQFTALAASLEPRGMPDASASGDGVDDPQPPDDFTSYDDDIHTDYQCPKCGYSWSGKPGAS